MRMADTPAPITSDSLDPALRRLQAALRDRYVLETELGSGGMGTVLKAHDVKHGRSVAIKVMRTTRAIDAERFHREVRTAPHASQYRNRVRQWRRRRHVVLRHALHCRRVAARAS